MQEQIIRRLAAIVKAGGDIPKALRISREEREQVKQDQIQKLKDAIAEIENEHKFGIVQVAGVTLVDGD